MDRSLRAVLVGTFTLRLSTGLTGATLTYYLAELGDHPRLLDQLFRFGRGEHVGDVTFGIIAALFYVSELALSPLFGVVSDRLGHYRVMQFGPVFGLVAVILTWATTSLPVIGFTRLLEGSATASSVPSILGFIAVATAGNEFLRGRASARFEAATLTGLLGGFVLAGFLWHAIGPETFLVNAVIYVVSFGIYRFGVDPAEDTARRARAAGSRGSTSVGTPRSFGAGTSGCSRRRGSRSTPSSGCTRPRRSSSSSDPMPAFPTSC